MPELPKSLDILCPCGARLRVDRQDYDGHVLCPRCGVKLLAILVQDSKDGHFLLEAVAGSGQGRAGTPQ